MRMLGAGWGGRGRVGRNRGAGLEEVLGRELWMLKRAERTLALRNV